jgi:hypothetical protein
MILYFDTNIITHILKYFTVREKNNLLVYTKDALFEKFDIDKEEFITQLYESQRDLDYKYIYSFINNEPFNISYSLILQGAKCNIKNNQNDTLIEREIKYKNKTNVRKIIKYFKMDAALFINVLSNKWFDMADKMLCYIDINIKTSFDGITALMWCCLNGDLEIINFLLNHGANVDIEDANGNTPLTYACYNGNNDVIETILLKTNINRRNFKNRTVLEELVMYKNSNIYNLLYLINKYFIQYHYYDDIILLCKKYNSYDVINIIYDILNENKLCICNF